MQKRIFGVSAILLAFLIMLVSSSNAQAIDADLVPVNFTFSPDYPVQGEAFDIYFEVINTGIEPASNVDIIVWNSTSECDADETPSIIVSRGLKKALKKHPRGS